MTLPPLLRQGMRYLVTGGGAAVVDIGGFWLLTTWHMPVLPAAVLSFCIAAVVNFTATTLFVFAARLTLRRFVSFFTFALVGLSINASVTWGLTTLHILPVLAKVGGVGVAFVANFLLNALVVYRKADEPHA